MGRTYLLTDNLAAYSGHCCLMSMLQYAAVRSIALALS